MISSNAGKVRVVLTRVAGLMGLMTLIGADFLQMRGRSRQGASSQNKGSNTEYIEGFPAICWSYDEEQRHMTELV